MYSTDDCHGRRNLTQSLVIQTAGGSGFGLCCCVHWEKEQRPGGKSGGESALRRGGGGGGGGGVSGREECVCECVFITSYREGAVVSPVDDQTVHV